MGITLSEIAADFAGGSLKRLLFQDMNEAAYVATRLSKPTSHILVVAKSLIVVHVRAPNSIFPCKPSHFLLF